MTVPTARFTKPALPPAALLAHLEAKGLVVADPVLAERALGRIGYYRLLIYMRPLQLPALPRRFKPGTTFEQILALYDLDRELRLLCLDAIERIEVALRAAIVNEVGVQRGPHFHVDPAQFQGNRRFQGIRQILADAKHLSITHYRSKYAIPPEPPIWCVTEALTFGEVSHLFGALHGSNQSLVARGFGFHERVLTSWFKALTTLRNVCAHHNRLWNAKHVVNQPLRPRRDRTVAAELGRPDTCYARLVVAYALLKAVDAAAPAWRDRLAALLGRQQPSPLAPMGFPADWLARPLWR